MAIDDVALALIALQDAGLRREVRTGGVAALEAHDFTAEEAALVAQAAADGPEDDPEVAGFGIVSETAQPALDYVVANQGALSPAVREQLQVAVKSLPGDTRYFLI